MEQPKNENSRQMFLSFTGSHGCGGGITFNPVSVDVESNGKDLVASKEEEEKSGTKEEAPVVAAENVSGVRKRLLNPAEDALESVRQTAELIVKDAMEALQRTKQRLMEILPHSLVSPSSTAAATEAADKASKALEEAKQQVLAKSEGLGQVSMDGGKSVNQENEEVTKELSSKAPGSISTEPAMGFIHPSKQRPASAMAATAELVHSRL